MARMTIRTIGEDYGVLFDGAIVLTADVDQVQAFDGVINQGKTLTVTITIDQEG